MAFLGAISLIPDSLATRMRAFSWRAQLPGGFVGPTFDQLRLLELSHWNFNAEERSGQLVVAASVAQDVLGVFEALYRAGFPIEQMRVIDDFEGSDERSMEANNTSGYNCRLIAGTTLPSRHASGLAIDINPVQNPYVIAGVVHPKAAVPFVDRTNARPGMLLDHGPAVRAFAAIGWQWGGRWAEPRDYHHFELARPA